MRRTLVVACWVLACGPGGLAVAGADARDAIERGRYAEALSLARGALAAQPAGSLLAADAAELLVEALHLAGEGARPEAGSLIEGVLAIRERLQGRSATAVAHTLNLAATLRMEEGVEAARTLLERALAIGERTVGRQEELASTCHLLGELEAFRGDYRAAVPWFERAMAIRERALGTDAADSALSRARHAWALIFSGSDVHRWEVDVPTALDRVERALGASHPRVAELLRTLSSCQVMASDTRGARASLERATAIDVAALGPDHPLFARDLLSVGVWGFDDALPRVNRAIGILERAYGADSPRLGNALQALGWHLVVTREDLDRARDLLERALTYHVRVYGPQAPRMVAYLTQLGTAYRERAEYRKARIELDRALAIAERCAPGDSLLVSEALRYLAGLLTYTGDYRTAKVYYERTLAIVERILGPDSDALPLSDLGEVAWQMRDLESSKALYQRALEILERKHAPENGEVIRNLTKLARVHIASEELGVARSLLDRALPIAEKGAAGAYSSSLVLVLRQLCLLHLAEGRFGDAVTSCERVQAGTAALWGSAHPFVAVSQGRVAAALFGRGSVDAAIDLALDAEESERKHFLKTAQSFSEREALHYGASRSFPIAIALSVLADRGPASDPKAISRVWDQVIRSRAMVLDEMASRHQVLRAQGTAGGAWIERVAAARADLIRSLASPRGGSPEALARAGAAVEAAEHALAEKSLVFGRREELSRVRIEDVFRSMPPRGALVAFAKYWRMRPAAPGSRLQSCVAFAWTGAASPSVVDLGLAEPIERLVEDWRRMTREPASEAAHLAAGTELRRAIWDPLRGFLGGAELVLIVPEGPLSLVSFAALPAPGGGYLIESGPALHVLSAERDVVDVKRPRAPGEGLLVVGAAAFDGAPDGAPDGSAFRGAPPACDSFRSRKFGALPRSLAEVDEVRALWSGNEPVVRLTGTEASEAAVRRLVPGRRVVHLATHGFFYGPECAGDARAGSVEANGLSLAGLALAGANRREEAGPDRDDGILTADEIASLDLTRAEWVVLSACDSGTGQVQDGEGVLGLRRSVQISGARTLIMSLWPVQDEMARQWMRRVYQARAQGATTVAAVQGAGRDLLETRRKRKLSTHPFYWGAFVAAGDWR